MARNWNEWERKKLEFSAATNQRHALSTIVFEELRALIRFIRALVIGSEFVLVENATVSSSWQSQPQIDVKASEKPSFNVCDIARTVTKCTKWRTNQQQSQALLLRRLVPQSRQRRRRRLVMNQTILMTLWRTTPERTHCRHELLSPRPLCSRVWSILRFRCVLQLASGLSIAHTQSCSYCSSRHRASHHSCLYLSVAWRIECSDLFFLTSGDCLFLTAIHSIHFNL